MPHSWTSPDQDSDPTIQCRQELVFCHQLVILNWGDFFLPRDICQCLETFMVVTPGEVLLTISEQRPWMLINILQCTGQSTSQQKIIWSQMSMVLRLKTPAEDLGPEVRIHTHTKLRPLNFRPLLCSPCWFDFCFICLLNVLVLPC